MDEILRFASKDTLFPIKHEVKRQLVSRDEVEAYVTKHTSEDEDAKRLRRSELVLKKFGLLPRDFDLGTFLVALLKEQVAGYYDPKTRTVNLLDWLGVDQQKPVLAHELTHALQDQSFNLEKYMKPADADLAKKKEITAQDIENDEVSTTRQAVVEGQAMVVLVDYMLEPMGLSLKDSPQVVQSLKDGMLVGTADSVQFHNAPIYMKEALTFPYRYGIDFIADLLIKGGKEKAFAELFRNPPRTTRQIMEPQTYLSGERLEPMNVPDFRQVFKNYERFDVGAVGEFDVAVLDRSVCRHAGFGQVISPLARRLLLRGALEGRSGCAAGSALCLTLVESGKGGQFCRDLCLSHKQTIPACARRAGRWQRPGGSSRSLGPSDWQARLAD